MFQTNATIIVLKKRFFRCATLINVPSSNLERQSRVSNFCFVIVAKSTGLERKNMMGMPWQATIEHVLMHPAGHSSWRHQVKDPEVLMESEGSPLLLSPPLPPAHSNSTNAARRRQQTRALLKNDIIINGASYTTITTLPKYDPFWGISSSAISF